MAAICTKIDQVRYSSQSGICIHNLPNIAVIMLKSFFILIGLFCKRTLDFLKYLLFSTGSICFNYRCVTCSRRGVGRSIDMIMRFRYRNFYTLGCSCLVRHILVFLGTSLVIKYLVTLQNLYLAV